MPQFEILLEAKRAEVRRAIATAERRPAQLRADLIHPDAALRLCQRPAAEPGDDDGTPARARGPAPPPAAPPA